jgi:hypothetical protein
MNTHPLNFQIPVRHSQWCLFLKTKKPEHSHDWGGLDSIDYGPFILYQGRVNNQRDLDIISNIGFKFTAYKNTQVWNDFFEQKGVELNWDFSFPVYEEERLPIGKTKGVKNIIEATVLKHSWNEIEKMGLPSWHYDIAKTAWNWINFRISSDAQDKYWAKYGKEKALEKINGFRARLGLKLLSF